MRSIVRATSVILLTFALAAPAARADVPQNMTIQGRLTDAAGNPVPAGLRMFTFKIFDAEVGGAENWPGGPGESQTLATDAAGLWTARVGAIIGLNEAVFKDTSCWLQVTVDDGINPPETLSRIKLNTNPFTYRAAWAQQADAINGNTLDDLTGQFVNITGDTMSGFLTVEFPNGNGVGSIIRANNANDGYAPQSLGFNTIGIVGEASSDGGEGKFGVIGFAKGSSSFSAGLYGQATGAGTSNIAVYGYIPDPAATENFSGYFWGGDFAVYSPATPGDSSVRLPLNAINNREILDEPGIAQGRNAGSVVLTESNATTTITSVTITTPADGYIYLQGRAYIEFSGSEASGYAFMQINEAAGDPITAGVYSICGLAPRPSISNQYFDCGAQRTFLKSAGSHTFYLAGKETSTGTVRAGYSILTALFIPRSYGTVTTVASASDAREFEDARAMSLEVPPAGAPGDISIVTYEVDLRELELRAERARAEAEKTQRELLEARMKLNGPRSDVGGPREK